MVVSDSRIVKKKMIHTSMLGEVHCWASVSGATLLRVLDKSIHRLLLEDIVFAFADLPVMPQRCWLTRLTK